jgi:hypothetical protein
MSVTGMVAYGLIAVFGIVLCTGHGKMLIAGFSLLSKSDREKTNTKALCRAIGLFILAADVGIFLAALSPLDWLIYLILGVAFVLVIPFVYWINKSNRFKK